MRNVLISALVLSLVCLLQAQVPHPPLASDRQVWNGVYAEMIRDDESFLPNAFLVKVVEGRTPGTALDIAMGQGRNALMLAQRGWDVTGIDISDFAVDTANAQAQKLSLKLNATVADLRKFDYGTERYDMAVATYVNGFVRRAKDVVRSLKPGGLLVVEGFHNDSFRGGFESNELLRYFPSMTVLYYEDAIGLPDSTWTDVAARYKDYRFVRLVARKEKSK